MAKKRVCAAWLPIAAEWQTFLGSFGLPSDLPAARGSVRVQTHEQAVDAVVALLEAAGEADDRLLILSSIRLAQEALPEGDLSQQEGRRDAAVALASGRTYTLGAKLTPKAVGWTCVANTTMQLIEFRGDVSIMLAERLKAMR